jgi:predicted flap endonuclease-1-like 5' DNA nuclease
MFNMPLLLETALLMLAAFLLGAAIGSALRWFVTRARAPVAAPVVAAAAPGAAGAPLVVAPEIAPVGARPSVADRIAAAAEGRSAALPAGGMSASIIMPRTELPDMPGLMPIQPSRAPGETVSGRHIDNPELAAPAPTSPVATAEAAAELAPPAAVIEPAPLPAVAAEPETEPTPQPAIAEPETAEPKITEHAVAEPTVVEPTIVEPQVSTPSLSAPAAETLAAAPLAPVLAAMQVEQLGRPEPAAPEVQGPASSAEPVVLHIEPTFAPDDLTVVDGPLETAEAIQDTHPLAQGASAPDVRPEAPLVEPDVERQAAEADESLLDRVDPEPAQPEPETPQHLPIEASTAQPPVSDAVEAAPEPTEAEAELAAMRAIERGWTPRPSAAPRVAADLPEGVSVGESEAADRAVANAGAAVASAAARAAAILNAIAPAPLPAENDQAGTPSASPVIALASEAEPPPTEPAPESRTGSRTPGGFGRPPALEVPRQGMRDQLDLIRGISPTIQSALNGLGIYHFDQIADWDQKAVVWVENHFGFKGRIARERWLEQARDLARGRPGIARPVRR